MILLLYWIINICTYQLFNNTFLRYRVKLQIFVSKLVVLELKLVVLSFLVFTGIVCGCDARMWRQTVPSSQVHPVNMQRLFQRNVEKKSLQTSHCLYEGRPCKRSRGIIRFYVSWRSRCNSRKFSFSYENCRRFTSKGPCNSRRKPNVQERNFTTAHSISETTSRTFSEPFK